ADAGFAPALVAYGDFYRRGQGVEKDPARAIPYYQQAATLGSSDAMNLVGLAYLRGEGVARNAQVGLDWLTRANDAGNPYAAFQLGRAFLKGDAVEMDRTKALAYFRLAAQRDYLGGYQYIGKILADGGDGIKADRPEALANYIIAREAAKARDTVDAKEELIDIEKELAALTKRMTSDEIAAGETSAANRIAQYGLLDFNLVNE
ncbi:MAG: tetratricopeptide repeat protein, partial [Paracoccaceae bacterium]